MIINIIHYFGENYLYLLDLLFVIIFQFQWYNRFAHVQIKFDFFLRKSMSFILHYPSLSLVIWWLCRSLNASVTESLSNFVNVCVISLSSTVS